MVSFGRILGNQVRGNRLGSPSSGSKWRPPSQFDLCQGVGSGFQWQSIIKNHFRKCSSTISHNALYLCFGNSLSKKAFSSDNVWKARCVELAHDPVYNLLSLSNTRPMHLHLS